MVCKADWKKKMLIIYAQLKMFIFRLFQMQSKKNIIQNRAVTISNFTTVL